MAHSSPYDEEVNEMGLPIAQAGNFLWLLQKKKSEIQNT